MKDTHDKKSDTKNRPGIVVSFRDVESGITVSHPNMYAFIFVCFNLCLNLSLRNISVQEGTIGFTVEGDYGDVGR